MVNRKSLIVAVLSIVLMFSGSVPVFSQENGDSNISFDTRHQSAPAEPWRFTFQFAPAYSLPGDADGTYLTSGIGFDGDIMFPLQERLAVRLSFGRSGLRVDDDKAENTFEYASLPPPEHIRIYHKKFEMSAYRYYLSGSYLWLPEHRRAGAMMYSMSGGVGVVTHLIEYEIYTINDSTGQIFRTAVDTTISFPAVTIRGEATAFLSSRIGINFGLGLDFVLVPLDNCLDCRDWSDRVTTYDATFDFRLGLLVIF